MGYIEALARVRAGFARTPRIAQLLLWTMLHPAPHKTTWAVRASRTPPANSQSNGYFLWLSWAISCGSLELKSSQAGPHVRLTVQNSCPKAAAIQALTTALLQRGFGRAAYFVSFSPCSSLNSVSRRPFLASLETVSNIVLRICMIIWRALRRRQFLRV